MPGENSVPFGYCHCGCGGKTKIAKRTDRARGRIAGQPFKYIRCHNRREPVPLKDRLLAKVEKRENGCWHWTGARTSTSNGYGRIYAPELARGAAPDVLAHRAAYLLFVGPIPEGLELDHLCRNRLCINPEHLEPVTHEVNQARGRRNQFASNTHCIARPPVRRGKYTHHPFR